MPGVCYLQADIPVSKSVQNTLVDLPKIKHPIKLSLIEIKLTFSFWNIDQSYQIAT